MPSTNAGRDQTRPAQTRPDPIPRDQGRPRRRRSVRRSWRTLLWHHLLRLRRTLFWLWKQEGSDGQRVRGLAAGVFTGCLPFFGLQIVLGVGLASLVRGNHLLAAAGTWISNPFTSLPLYWLNYRIGCLLLGEGPVWPDLGRLQAEEIQQLGMSFSARLLLGSSVVGLLAALFFGGLYWLWLRHSTASLLRLGR